MPPVTPAPAVAPLPGALRRSCDGNALGTHDALHGTHLVRAEHKAYPGGQVVLLRRAPAARGAGA